VALPSVPICDPSSQNVQAFLKLLRWCENYPNDGASTYLTMYGGKVFTYTSQHPNVANTKWGKTSTAAGAYMFLYTTWKEAKDKGIVDDFTPAAQDKLAWWKIGQRRAQAQVCGGRNTLENAIKLLRLEWASLPGASQNQISLQSAKNQYEKYLLEFSPVKQAGKP
jgi:muramidase (phage lysozyme)